MPKDTLYPATGSSASATDGYSLGYNPKNPVTTTKKQISYVANGTDSTQILSISGTDSSSAVKTGTP